MLKRPLSLLMLTFLLVFQSSCGQTRAPAEHAPGLGQSGQPRYTNALIHESSPYLLQHAHNPVHWYPWGEAALKKARDEHKMLIISIGYAACHWCHVMERESYEDTAVARLMNEHFVSIKVDREERPDVDQVYLTAAQLITGSGGWPLNALATPDGKPFYAGTYFPRDEWMKMLRFYIDLNQKNPAALRAQAAQVTQGIHSAEPVPFRKAAAPVTPAMLDAAFGAMQPRLDYANGGEAGTPKFPMPAVWEYLLYYHYLSQNPAALTAVTTTLERLAMGGIYDQVGGGFARYSTDARWHVPHFEKMLYDNAQLVGLYAHAYQATKNPLYKQVVYETLGFIEREMTAPEGGFYASLNADSEGEEGKFYAWTKPEIDQVLGRDAALFEDYFHVTASGNWEQGKNILFRRPDERALAAKYRRTEAQVTTTIEADKALLLRARNQRVRPTRDDKILTAWNALMLKGYVQAYRAFGDERFLQAALKNADFLGRRATTNANGLTRNYQNGRASIAGFLDDYAFTIAAYIELYQATFDEKWLRKAKDLAAYAQAHFEDPASKMFFYTDDTHSGLIARKMELTDNVIPASNSEMAKNLYYLGHYFADEGQLTTARQMLANVQHEAQQNPYYYANWGQLEAAMASGVYEVAIVGKEYQRDRRAMDQYYLPNTVLLGSSGKTSLELLADKEVEGQTTIYVCQDKVCRRPVTEVREAVQQIQAR